MPEILIRLIIGVLVYFLGEKIIGFIQDSDVKQILHIILLIVVVIYVLFGNIF